MSSVRSMFEQNQGPAPVPQQKTTSKPKSKWSQPQSETTPTEEVIVPAHEEETEEMPPAGYSRSLVQKFSQFESKAAPPPTSVEYSSSERTERVRHSQTPDSGKEVFGYLNRKHFK